MSFMQPEITSEPFLVGDNEHCERSACPLSAWMTHSTIKRNDNDALAKAMAVYAESEVV